MLAQWAGLLQALRAEYTTLDVTPQEVHDTGMVEVQRIWMEMDAVIREAGWQRGFREFLGFLRTEKRFYVDTPEVLLKEAALILKKMDGELPGLFCKLPRMPYGRRQVKDHITSRTTTACYFLPAGGGTKAGFYYVNTYDLKSRPLCECAALSLHDAVLGTISRSRCGWSWKPYRVSQIGKCHRLL